MNVYTYSEARQQLAGVLEQAAREGQVRIRRKDGQAFVIRPEQRAASPLDVPGLDLDMGADEIVSLVRESRREYWASVDWRVYVDDAAAPGGAACLRNTQLPVATILDELADGPGPDEIARRRPGLSRAAVEAALRYAADLLRR